MMKWNAIALLVCCVLIIAYSALAQQHVRYSVLAIEYIGDSDKPTTPIVISDSKAGAEWFRSSVLKKSALELTALHVVSPSVLKLLIRDAGEHGSAAQKEGGYITKLSTSVSVTIVRPEGQDKFLLTSEAAYSMLDNLKKLCKDDSLRVDISVFQKRIRP